MDEILNEIEKYKKDIIFFFGALRYFRECNKKVVE